MDEFNKKEMGKEKLKGLMTEDEIRKRKIRKRKAVISVFVFLLAVGIGGNWYWENSDISSKVNSITTPVRTLGEATFVDATAEVSDSGENEYFSSARLERQQARDEALEKLQAVVSATDEDDEARKLAAEQIAAYSSYIEIEKKIESLVEAKGVNNALAVVSEDGSRVDVIVDCSELTDELILQIKEIAIAQLNCGFENVTIIQSE